MVNLTLFQTNGPPEDTARQRWEPWLQLASLLKATCSRDKNVDKMNKQSQATSHTSSTQGEMRKAKKGSSRHLTLELVLS